MKNKGVIVYALGVGSGPDRAELEEIASGPEYVFTSSSFKDLQNIVPRITGQLCEGLYYKSFTQILKPTEDVIVAVLNLILAELLFFCL